VRATRRPSPSDYSFPDSRAVARPLRAMMNFDLDLSLEILRRSPATLRALLCSWKLTARELDLPGEHPTI